MTGLSISADVHDDVTAGKQMYSAQSSVDFIVIFCTKHLRIKWSNITRSQELCTKYFTGHYIKLVL